MKVVDISSAKKEKGVGIITLHLRRRFFGTKKKYIIDKDNDLTVNLSIQENWILIFKGEQHCVAVYSGKEVLGLERTVLYENKDQSDTRAKS